MSKVTSTCVKCGDLVTAENETDLIANITTHYEKNHPEETELKATRPESAAEEGQAPTPIKDAPSARTKLAKALEQQFTAVGFVIFPFDQVCGGHVMERAEPLAVALDRLAKENPKVKKALEGLLQVSTWGEVLTQAAILIGPILLHHDMLPKDLISRIPGMGKGEDANTTDNETRNDKVGQVS